MPKGAFADFELIPAPDSVGFEASMTRFPHRSLTSSLTAQGGFLKFPSPLRGVF
jgi:hypothetical protein